MSHLTWHQLNSYALQTLSWLSVFTLGGTSAWGQITPEGTTSITTTGAAGEHIQITGGQQSAEGENLFHQFGSFNVEPAETVTFVAPTSVENILGRINGGQATTIDGTLAATTDANLWLLNPAGILFGPNASLNLQGDFTATTADAIGFIDGWFNDASDYQNLVGAPQSLAFISSSGHLVNLGELQVASGQTLRLLGGSVLNGGTLTAPAGTIVVGAIANNQQVNINSGHQVLSLDIQPWAEDFQNTDITPVDLPTLLTGGNVTYADTLTVNEDGTVQLTQTATNLELVAGQTVITDTLTTTGQQGGQIAILGDHVSLLDATLNADGHDQGGQIYIGGNYQGLGPLPNATYTGVNQGTDLSANALQQGDGGQIIVWADDTTSFQGTASAHGGQTNGNGGLIEISGKSNLSFTGSFDVDAPQGDVGTVLFDPDNIQIVDGFGTANGDIELLLPNLGEVIAEDGDGGWFTINEGTLEVWSGNADIVLQANNDIIIQNLGGDNALTFRSGSGSISFIADADNDGAGDFLVDHAGDLIDTAGRDITISGDIINIQFLDTGVGDATLVAQDSIYIQETLNAGDVTLTAQNTIEIQEALTADTINLQGNGIALNGGNDSISGNTLSLQPWDPGQVIDVGTNTSSGALNLLESDIQALKDGFTSISIGRSDGTGSVILYDAVADGGAAAFQDPVTILGAGTLQGPDQLTTWAITGNSQGNLDSIFTNGLTFENVSSIASSNNTSNILQGTDGNDTITLSKINGGTFKGIDFDGIQNIHGGGGDDTIIFTNGVAELSGAIDGGSGNNTLNYKDYLPNNVVLNLETSDVSGTGGFSNIQQIIGSADGLAPNIIQGTSGNDEITLTADGTGSINGIGFQDFEIVTPGDGDDRIIVNGGTWSNINGGAGTDTLDYSFNPTTGVTIDLENQTVNSVTTFTNIEDFRGGSGVDTLVGTSGADTISITGNNSGTVGSITFSAIENLDGQAGNDRI
ncbi:MAG: filamentous hemagglutinin N-terminal domain-containing protein, partial [Leptolyngbyaceae cyanobacterium MAG.088]|nr:filamentous hemagglutinin N-terminal domain-containing protein [Leptolyngbyaceae cyanobacterium MAG.088]